MIELVHIRYHYGNKKVLSDCSLTISDNEITTITGKNGSGKSTIALLIAGMLQPQGGRIVVEGKEMNNNRATEELRRHIGIVFENPDNQFITTSVERELAFGLENLGVEPHSIRKRVTDTIERFSLESIRNRPPHTLSGGEKQKVAIAATLIACPRYLILDEPTIFLDPVSRETVKEIIASLRGEHTIVLISQFPSEILLGDRIYQLRDGYMEGPMNRRSVFELLRTHNATMRFLQALKGKGIFEEDTVPTIAELCAALEERRKKQ